VAHCQRQRSWDFKNTKGKHWKYGTEFTAQEIANGSKREVVSLLERFFSNPTQTRHEVRVRLGVLNEVAAEVFALTVFLCDNLLRLKPTLISSNHATRFFAISTKLPMDLQMVLCHRAVGSMKQHILHEDSEAAFKLLARNLLLAAPRGIRFPPREHEGCIIG